MSQFNPDLPTKEDIEEFVRDADKPVTKRDVANAFGIKGQGRIAMKRMLKELVAEGLIRQTASQTYQAVDTSTAPSIATLRVTELTLDGEILAEPADDAVPQVWADGARIEINPDPKKTKRAPAVGDMVLARIFYVHDHLFYADVLKVLAKPRSSIIGRIMPQGKDWMVQPVDRRERNDYLLEGAAEAMDKLENRLLVEVEPLPHKGVGVPKARLKQVIGHDDDPKAISLIAIHEYGLRHTFPDSVIEQTDGMTVPALGKREDLRDIPLVTIDGSDARDFDDAVFAEKDTDPNNKGGYHLLVAIADVSHYVTPDSPLDREAYKRGNSTYFPDRVVPMLPEALSNDLCSLRPHEPRACMAMHLWIDAQGNLLRYKPVRGLMRSVARLVYEQVQAAIEGVTDSVTDTLVEPVLRPLYEVFEILAAARLKRGSLDIEMPERQVMIDDKGNMTGVRERTRLDSHRLIEEFMILANVAAAMALEKKDAGCIYRVHGRPSEEKLDSARTFLDSLGYSLPKGQVINPANLNAILYKAKGTDTAHIVNEIVLRSQAQAVYSPENEGHFGLGLQKYAHFTSPIRRYADLIVHRSLIRAYGLGDGGLSDEQSVRLAEISESISKSERLSMEAERASVDRFTASWLADHAGMEFDGRISGVSRFGVFVRLAQNGAEGIVPIRSLPGDFYVHDEQHHALVGRRSGRVFRLCAPVRVLVLKADRLTGSASFEIVNAERGADIPGFVLPTMRRSKRFGDGGPNKGGGNKGSGFTKSNKKTHRKGKSPHAASGGNPNAEAGGASDGAGGFGAGGGKKKKNRQKNSRQTHQTPQQSR